MTWMRTAATLGLALAINVGIACDSRPLPTASPTTPSAIAGLSAHSHHGSITTGAAGSVAVNPTPDMAAQLDELRRLTAPFHNFAKAVEYGYSVAAPGEGVCISDPVRGGMGFHYTRGDVDLIDDGEVDLLRPEFLVYAPTANGGRKFAALDYFVPYNTWTQVDPPSLLGVPFQREDAFQAFVLHIWLYWHNPSGFFQNYNPSVPLC